MKNHPTRMIPIIMIPIKMMPMEDPMLDCLPTTSSQRKMLSRNMPRKKLRNEKLLPLMPWAISQKTTLSIALLLEKLSS